MDGLGQGAIISSIRINAIAEADYVRAFAFVRGEKGETYVPISVLVPSEPNGDTSVTIGTGRKFDY